MQERGSLAGLVFLNPDHPLIAGTDLKQGSVVTDKHLIRDVKCVILRYNEILFENLDSATLMSY